MERTKTYTTAEILNSLVREKTRRKHSSEMAEKYGFTSLVNQECAVMNYIDAMIHILNVKERQFQKELLIKEKQAALKREAASHGK